jgi:hypothetical protein
LSAYYPIDYVESEKGSYIKSDDGTYVKIDDTTEITADTTRYELNPNSFIKSDSNILTFNVPMGDEAVITLRIRAVDGAGNVM